MGGAVGNKGSGAAAALLASMKAVQQALSQPAGVPTNQLITRLQEWQQLVTELASTVARGEELATLYEAGQALNSTLNLSETLNLVIDSLIHLTGAERGCLGLYDNDGNLEIRAARHFDQESTDLFDLELSRTVVRDAVEKGQPVLTTNAQVDPRFSGRESVVGYHLRSIICVPLQMRGRVIGALYLDNRIKEGVFTEADLSLLMAFANQAAIAIENARLYTMTDQALAARVEELTTLQQIDQELNASLDFERVLQLTLSWAMRATAADEGVLCILDDGGIAHMITAGGNAPVSGPDSEAVQIVMRSQGPLVIGRLRILVPIRCRDHMVGLLDLRSNGNPAFRPEHAQFASRLADHAAVAIENARLYEEVRQANQAKSEFISLVAHELRTPMTSIRGYADMMARGMVGPMSPQQVDFARIICSNVERMQVLVSDLQDISRIETGQLRLEIKPIALSEAVRSALQSTRSQIEARAQQLAVDVPDALMVNADPARTTQVLINLLSNACKYTPEGGRIGVRARVDGSYVYCAVSDNGIGMSAEDQMRLFTKFFRSENPVVRETPGTGLGLCIVKSLVELQGGVIAVESEPGRGTTFTFTLPAATEA